MKEGGKEEKSFFSQTFDQNDRSEPVSEPTALSIGDRALGIIASMILIWGPVHFSGLGTFLITLALSPLLSANSETQIQDFANYVGYGTTLLAITLIALGYYWVSKPILTSINGRSAGQTAKRLLLKFLYFLAVLTIWLVFWALVIETGTK